MLPRFAALPLLLCLPAIWRFGFALAARATGDQRLARVLAVGAAVSSWLLAVHGLGRLTHSFPLALFTGTVLVAALGVLSLLWRLPGERSPLVHAWAFWLCLAVAIGLLLGPELRWAEHDECLVAGHIAVPLEIQNGVYPPRHTTFPQFELRYHYAIDLAGAVVSTLLGRLDMTVSVHLLAVLLWAYAFWLFWVIGERLIGGPWSGPLTALGVLFAGGAPFFCHPLNPLSHYLTSDCSPAGTWITPPLISNFLQHPWSLGIPLFACILLLLPARADDLRNPFWWGLLSILMAFLSLSQIVLFVCLLPSIVALGSLEGWRPTLPSAIRFLAWGLGMAVAARLLHGFFAPVLEPHGSGIEVSPFLSNSSFAGWASWHLQAFGLLLPLGFLGLRFFRGDRRLLATLVIGSLLARNLFSYSHSWDIVKFSMVTQLGLALLSAATLAQGFASVRWRAPAAVAFALTIAFGVAWPSALALNLSDGWFCRDLGPPPSAPDQAAIAWLRGRVSAGQAVFRSERAEVYATRGGLAQPSWDWGVESFGFSPSLLEQRRRLLEQPALSPEALRRQGFSWLVVGPKDAALADATTRWAQDGRAELAAEFPPLRIYKLIGP